MARMERMERASQTDPHEGGEGEGMESRNGVWWFYHVVGPRARVAGAFINFCGTRPEDLGWEDGAKGLRLKHLPKLHITADGFEVEAVPMRLEVPSELNKGHRAYTTFLGAQGIDYLLAYLESRRNQGETLTPNSPVLKHKGNS